MTPIPTEHQTPQRHRVETFERQGGYASRCLEVDCDAVTFGGFTTRTEARAALRGHEEVSSPATQPADPSRERSSGAALAGSATAVLVDADGVWQIRTSVGDERLVQLPAVEVDADGVRSSMLLGEALVTLGFYGRAVDVGPRSARFETWPIPDAPPAPWGTLGEPTSLWDELHVDRQYTLGSVCDLNSPSGRLTVQIWQVLVAREGGPLSGGTPTIDLDGVQDPSLDAAGARELARLLIVAAQLLEQIDADQGAGSVL